MGNAATAVLHQGDPELPGKRRSRAEKAAVGTELPLSLEGAASGGTGTLSRSATVSIEATTGTDRKPLSKRSFKSPSRYELEGACALTVEMQKGTWNWQPLKS